MAELGLYGPFPFTDDGVDANIRSTAPGAYALGKSSGGVFYISYVGRSDTDLNGRLHEHVGKYTHFKAAFFETPKDAFEKECNLYHDFGPPDNSVHPARPQGTNYRCPVPGCGG